MIIQHVNQTHATTCLAAELNRQNAIAAAGSNAAACKAADIAFYRAIISSCLANNLAFSNFTQALINLGTGGA